MVKFYQIEIEIKMGRQYYSIFYKNRFTPFEGGSKILASKYDKNFKKTIKDFVKLKIY